MAEKDLEPRVQSLEDALREFVRSQADARKEQHEEIVALGRKIDQSNRPNWLVYLTGLAVVITIWYADKDSTVKPIEKDISHLYELQATSESREVKATDNLDIKLQHEISLALAATDKGVSALDAVTKERDSKVKEALDGLYNWKDYTIKADLDELRQRRLNDQHTQTK